MVSGRVGWIPERGFDGWRTGFAWEIEVCVGITVFLDFYCYFGASCYSLLMCRVEVLFSGVICHRIQGWMGMFGLGGCV